MHPETLPDFNPIPPIPYDGIPWSQLTPEQQEQNKSGQTDYCIAVWDALCAQNPDEPGRFVVKWRNSSQSKPNETNVWVGMISPSGSDRTLVIAIRPGTVDEPDPSVYPLLYTVGEWDAFVGGAKDGEFDLRGRNPNLSEQMNTLIKTGRVVFDEASRPATPVNHAAVAQLLLQNPRFW